MSNRFELQSCPGFNSSARDPSSLSSKELCEVVNGSVPANGELHIVDGPTRNLGRVEVYLNGVWGTVCGAHTQFSRPSGEVICRQLGYKSWSNMYYRPESAGYGSGDGPRHITRLNCSGGKNTILDCYRENATISPCGPADIMAVRCNTNLLLNPFGGVTLIGGSGGHGNLFIKEPRGFAPICDHTFGEKEGDVACRQMGYARAINVVRNSYYAIGRLPAALSHIHCHGNETHLLQCDHRNDSKNHCDDYDQVGLQYSTDNDHREGGLRLVGGSSSAGAVELFLNGKWNRICSVNFKLPDAHVACRQLGFSGATRFYNDGRFGSSNNGIFAMLGCHGSEETLFNCSHTPLEPLYCAKDIAISCSLEPICEEGSVRLTGGASNVTGRLEVCEYGRWGSVCSRAFDDKDALVTCKQFGFYAMDAFTESGRIVPNDIPIDIFASHCHGDEANLTSCEHEVSPLRCNHSLDVVLTCRACDLKCVNGGLDSDNCKCICYERFTGKICNAYACDPACVRGTCTEDRVCVCPEGWTGEDCNTPVCDPACVRGTCTEDRVRACPEGWIGEDCTPKFNVTPSVTYDAVNQTLNIVHYPPEGNECKCVFRRKKKPCLPRDTMSGVQMRKNEKGRLVITCKAGGISYKLSMQVRNE